MSLNTSHVFLGFDYPSVMYFIYLPEAPSTSNFWILFLHWVVLPAVIDRLCSCLACILFESSLFLFFCVASAFDIFFNFYVKFFLFILLYFIVTLFRRMWIWLHNFPWSYGRRISFHSLIRMIYLLCRFFSILQFYLIFCWFLWKDFQVDIVQPQYFGHVAWLDSLPLSDIISSFVYIFDNSIYIYIVQWFHFLSTKLLAWNLPRPLNRQNETVKKNWFMSILVLQLLPILTLSAHFRVPCI